KARHNGIELHFNFSLDSKSAMDPASYEFTQWNYKWQASYGSAQWSVKDPNKQGRDPVKITGAQLSANSRSVFLEIEDFQPVNQILAKIKLKDRLGQTFDEEIYFTINRVPSR
ncbi:MAG: hypothetical protein ACPGVU_15045, partial [Limisphaerales bacterium]